MKAAALIGTLSVSLYTILLFAYTLTPAQTHHVVFEEIGEMAGALSYIHVVVPINISGLLQSVNNFRAKVAVLKANYVDHKKFANRLDYFGGWSATNHTKHALVLFRQQLSGLMDLMMTDADNLQSNIISLRNSLPQVAETPPGPLQASDLREKRNAALTILSGVFGTLMGWFTHRRLNNLRDQIGEVRDQQHRFLRIQQITLARLDDLETVLREVVLEMERSENTWVNYFALDHARVQLYFHTQKLTRALQAAHLRRLSVDLLDGKQLRHIFDTTSRKAQALQYQLMIRHPSDLFQIETSYMHDGRDVKLLLHVPMAPAESILRLFQLLPFPLPFTDSHFLMPDPANQILALSSGVDRLSVEMSVANLLSCHRINSAYLCERHGVLRRQLNTTCLGSLYIQDFNGAMTLCEMRIVEHTETVLQMQDNWYLVYSPIPFTGYVICLNNSNSEVFIKTGPNRIFVSPSCRMRLKHHVLISDFSLRLDSVIKHYEWDLDEIAFSPEERVLSERWLKILGTENVGRSTLHSIRQEIAAERRSSTWIYLFSLMGTLIAVIFAVAGSYVLWVRYSTTLKTRILHVLMRTLPEPVLNLLQPPQPDAAPAPAPQQQPLLEPAQ
jgi:hypothetical protein